MPRRARSQRGSTLIELMIAAAILLVAMAGFIHVASNAAQSTAQGHRRTVGAYVRQELLDRALLTPRDRLDAVTANTWFVDACYDLDSRQLGARNVAFDAAFACPDGATYRSWVQFSPIPGATRLWRMNAYAERIVPGCTAAQRYQSRACLAADFVVSD